jgi:hypothetical protein
VDETAAAQELSAGHVVAGGARSQRGGCELVEPLFGYPGASNGLTVGGTYASITEDPWGGCIQPAAIHRGQARRGSATAARAKSRLLSQSRASENHV